MSFSEKTKINQGIIDPNILSEQNLKFVIVSTKQLIVERADTVAQRQPFGVKRIVVWVKNFDERALINQLPALPNNLDECVAFSLSTKNKIGHLFKIGDSISKIRIDSSFIKAGKTINN
jgi:hypothetical protein